MSATTTVGGGGSPQRESVPTDRPVNGEGENTALSDNSPTSTEPTKVCYHSMLLGYFTIIVSYKLCSSGIFLRVP